jgi:hypothetical protein
MARVAALRKTAFLSHLNLKTNILPRQARDKHRENSKKRCRFSHLAVALQTACNNSVIEPPACQQKGLEIPRNGWQRLLVYCT